WHSHQCCLKHRSTPLWRRVWVLAMAHDDLRKLLLTGGKILVAEGQDDFTRGHISARLPDDPTRFLMKPHSVGLDEITADNILTIGLDGEVIAGSGRRHSEVY